MPSAVLAVALSLLGFVPAADDSRSFEQMHIDNYTTLLHQGAEAYGRKDYAQAFPLVQRAACGGDKDSQALVGRMYVLGQGVAGDAVTGYAWIRTAAELHAPEYEQLAHKLEQAMPLSRRDAANEKAREYRGIYGATATHMSCTSRTTLGTYAGKTIGCTPSEGTGVLVKIHRCESENGGT